MLTGCHVALMLRGRQKKPNYFQMRTFFPSLSHVGTRGVSKRHKSEICAVLPIFASSGCPPTQAKRKNEEEKHRMEVG